MPNVHIESLIDQLWEIYQLENWHRERLNKEQADEYHRAKLARGELLTVEDNGRLVGYLEFSYAHGVCFIINTYILPEYRRGMVAKMLKKRLFEIVGKCKIFLGERNRFNTRYPEVQMKRS